MVLIQGLFRSTASPNEFRLGEAEIGELAIDVDGLADRGRYFGLRPA